MKGIIFDLDGTLLNSLEDLAMSCNRTLVSFGYTPHALEAYKKFVGNGIKKLVERAFPVGFEHLDKALDFFIDDYAKHCTDASVLYDGVKELLSKLEQANVVMGICTNKQQALTDKIVRHYLNDVPFVSVLGDRFDDKHKPNPQGPLHIASAMNLDPSAILFVGDSDVDMITASRAGMKAVGVSWGFRDQVELVESGADVIVHEPLEILNLFF